MAIFVPSGDHDNPGVRMFSSSKFGELFPSASSLIMVPSFASII